jgi:hypothetical protein
VFRKIMVAALICLAGQTALAINKCTDSGGKVSYQDGPCPSENTAMEMDLPEYSENHSSSGSPNSNVDSIIVTVPGVGEVAMMKFSNWDIQTRKADGDNPPTVKMVSQPDAMNLSLTFIPNRVPRILSEDEQASAVRKIGEHFVSGSIEKRVSLRRLSTPIGNAVLANFNERKYQNSPVPKGEYSSITTGLVTHELMTVAVTILTNGPNTMAHDDALAVIGSLLLIDL